MLIATFSVENAMAQFDKINFGDYGISSIRPQSLKSVKGSAWIDIKNRASAFKISEISGVVYKGGSPFVKGRANDLYIPSGSKRCSISGDASLCEGVSLWSVLSLLSFNAKDYAVDVSMKVTTSDGKQRVISKKKVPLSKLLKK